MTQKETSNIILKLRQKGWVDKEITDFLLYIETHNPTEKEVIESNKKANAE